MCLFCGFCGGWLFEQEVKGKGGGFLGCGWLDGVGKERGEGIWDGV